MIRFIGGSREADLPDRIMFLAIYSVLSLGEDPRKVEIS